jgi:hypothetical protein
MSGEEAGEDEQNEMKGEKSQGSGNEDEEEDD